MIPGSSFRLGRMIASFRDLGLPPPTERLDELFVFGFVCLLFLNASRLLTKTENEKEGELLVRLI